MELHEIPFVISTIQYLSLNVKEAVSEGAASELLYNRPNHCYTSNYNWNFTQDPAKHHFGLHLILTSGLMMPVESPR